MQPRVILNSTQLQLTINRLCFQLIENHNDFSDTVLVGLQPRGKYMLNAITEQLSKINKKLPIVSGNLDVTFYRDDFRRGDVLKANTTEIDFLTEGKKVVLVDDVLYTGRTIRAGLEAINHFGRPESVELLVLIDRRFSRHLPIQPDYTGKTVDSVTKEKVKVEWQETDGKNQVLLYTPNE
ncbi:MAG: bifunctional pyr operon transcriptional regulator/uracil phosphoribosyltransferase PyrR [Flavobacteriales bacterium]|nr:bifunctional pyr operon transcriptional regulator/uracil phosphoribosyltransferase PyrR [Flavobacteriales bacterium]